jgi:hypothetical protein
MWHGLKMHLDSTWQVLHITLLDAAGEAKAQKTQSIAAVSIQELQF